VVSPVQQSTTPSFEAQAFVGNGEARGLLRAALADRLARADIVLPLPPRIATEVLALSRDQDADFGRIAQLLHQDPALAGHVLRIANSPAYLPRSPIVSLQQAITRLGLRLLAEIALIASVQSGVFRVPGYESDLRQIWRHALASGAFGREVARSLRSNVESAFLCGLLHTIGKPLVLQTTIDLAGKLGLALQASDVATLIAEFHVQAGGLLASRWGLPRAVCDAIALYASYDASAACAQEPVITALGDRLATHLLAGETDEADLRAHRAWIDLNLYPEDADALIAKAATVSKLIDTMVL
jgi:HD-like signal output (HDOD) protein